MVLNVKKLIRKAFLFLAFSILSIFPILLAAILVGEVMSLWSENNPLAKYGVSFEKTSGEHEEYQTIWFYWDKDQKRIKGPGIVGDDLRVTFKTLAHNEIPEIIVTSDTYKSQFVVLKLNFTDRTKPEFELIENHMLGVHYPPPWQDYYKVQP